MNEELEKQFMAEKAALYHKIKNNKRSRKFAILVLILVWASVIMDVVALFKLGNDTTLKYIRLQNNLHFDCLWAFIYSLWCTYSIPEGEKLCIEALDSFIKRWSPVEKEIEEEV